MAQNPETAAFAEMPESAALTTSIDGVLDAADIPAAILRYVRCMEKIEEEIARKENAAPLPEYIHTALQEQLDKDFRGSNAWPLPGRICRRMQQLELDSPEDYAKHLRQDRKEAEKIGRDLPAGVPRFFADTERAEFLQREILSDLLRSKRSGDDNGVLRLWLPRCATGEEAYYYAFLLYEEMTRLDAFVPVQIFATDSDESALAIARRGRYGTELREQMPPEYLEKYFAWQAEGYKVLSTIREMLVFSTHDILTDSPYSRIDLLVSRNLLPFLNRKSRQKALTAFHYALGAGGHLLLGETESPSAAAHLFTRISKKHNLFQARADIAASLVDFPLENKLPVTPATGGNTSGKSRIFRERLLGECFEKKLLQRYVPLSAVLDEDGDIHYWAGRRGRFLDHPGGHPQNNHLAIAHKNLRQPLRHCLQEAALGGREAVRRNIMLDLGEGWRPYTLTVAPFLDLGPDNGLYYAVVREERGPPPGHPPSEEANRPESERGHRTGEATGADDVLELQEREERFRLMVEELEAANEEQRTSYEEIYSLNEELHTKNEELHAVQEELYSVNQELEGVNQELRTKVENLVAAKSDLQNLFDSSEIATLFLDNRLRVTTYTPALQELVRIRPADIGRPVADITTYFNNINLAEEVAATLDRLEKREIEVQTVEEDKFFLLRIAPYTTLDGRVDGAVLNFVSITEMHKAREKLARRSDQLHNLTARILSFEQKERKRFSLFLHDEIQQSLVAVKMLMAQVQNATDSEQTKTALSEGLRLLGQTIDNTRTISRDLSPPLFFETGIIHCLEWLTRWAGKKLGLRLGLRVDGEDRPISEEAGYLLYRAYREMLFNIHKHAGVGDAEIVLVFTGQGGIETSVEDKGKGFDPALLESASSAHFGLQSIVEQVRALDGSISIDSTDGQGTRISLTLPPAVVAERNHVPPAPEAGSPAEVTGTPRKHARHDDEPTILIADDQEDLRFTLRLMLEDLSGDYTFLEAEDARQAIETVQEYRPNLVLMDVSMPGMSGVEATRRIKAHAPATTVIGLSMHEREDMEKAMREAGAAGYLTKDSEAEVILAEIRRCLML